MRCTGGQKVQHRAHWQFGTACGTMLLEAATANAERGTSKLRARKQQGAPKGRARCATYPHPRVIRVPAVCLDHRLDTCRHHAVLHAVWVGSVESQPLWRGNAAGRGRQQPGRVGGESAAAGTRRRTRGAARVNAGVGSTALATAPYQCLARQLQWPGCAHAPLQVGTRGGAPGG